MIKALRGMKDFLGDDAKKYQYCVEQCSRIAQNYGFEFIQTPTLEETKLFKRSVGESSDIVGKEMYNFTDKGKNEVCLRPEGTAGVVRAFLEAKLDRSLANYRFYYYESMYRYERPQRGRLRQFHQFGIESFGLDDTKEDASIILLAREILDFFGIKYTLKLNSIGCPECMPTYKKKLVGFLEKTEGICEDCLRRKDTNPIRVLDCKNETCKALLAPAPRLLDNLCPTCKSDFEQLQEILKKCKVDFEVDTNLVRGLDYYSKTAFEFVSDELGAQGTLIGGGRYDKLVQYLDGKPTPAIGFAMGFERIMELVNMPKQKREGYYFGSLDEEGFDMLLTLATKTRKKEKVFLDYQPRSLKAHLKQADKKNALYFLCAGSEDVKNGLVRVKNLESKEEKNLHVDELGSV